MLIDGKMGLSGGTVKSEEGEGVGGGWIMHVWQPASAR